MANVFRRRRLIATLALLLLLAVSSFSLTQEPSSVLGDSSQSSKGPLALEALNQLSIKDSASSSGYSRDQFGSGWQTKDGCDTRNTILYRDLKNAFIDENCIVLSGTLDDPYTGKQIEFKRGASTSSDIQIDHVVALSDAWQKGAQDLSREVRITLANDPLELLAVDGSANQQKSGSDASKWLPSNKIFNCQYVTRQIAVKVKYKLWVSSSELNTIKNTLSSCRYQLMPN